MKRLLLFSIVLFVVPIDVDAAELSGIVNLTSVGESTPGITFDDSYANIGPAGDFNQDGFDDILIGSVGLVDQITHLVYGSQRIGTVPLTMVGTAIPGLKFVGPSDEFAGTSVFGGGDFNGDGIADIAIGAPNAEGRGISPPSAAGKTYVVFGGQRIDETGGRVDLGLVGGSLVPGVVVVGDTMDERSGTSVSLGGDFNNDGISDLIIGAPPVTSVSAPGQAYVVYGDTLLTGTVELDDIGASLPGAQLTGPSVIDRTGQSVASAGDFNGDGIDDFIVGAPDGFGGFTRAGRAYLLFGGSGLDPQIDLVDVGGSVVPGIKFLGEMTDDHAGISVSPAGDVNGDGLADVLIGADQNRVGPGRAYLVFGSTGLNGAIPLQDIGTTVNGAVFDAGSGDLSTGADVSAAGDFNGDGLDDFLISTESSTLSALHATYLVYGSNSLGGSLSLDDVGQGLAGATFRGPGITRTTNPLKEVAPAGDTNNDGIDDLLISSGDGTHLIYGRPDTATWYQTESGLWNGELNWQGFQTPQDDDDVSLSPASSVTISGPTSDLQLASLRVGGNVGTATLDLSSGAVISSPTSVIETTGVLTGDGVLDSAVTNFGIVEADNLVLARADTGLVNHGLIQGNGRLDAHIVNEAAAHIRVGAGGALRLTRQFGMQGLTTVPAVSNLGQIEVIRGDFESQGEVHNTSGGQIFAQDGTLRFLGGLENDSRFLVSFGNANVFGPIHNDVGAQTIVSGNATATFLDTMDNDGAIVVTSDSTVVLFGDYTGIGNFGGGGTIHFHGNFAPGASPGRVHLEADLQFESTARFEVEIMGMEAGTDYDQVHVDGQIQLGGVLDFQVDESMRPLVTAEFRLFDFLVASEDNISGGFSSVLMGDQTFVDQSLHSGDGHFHKLIHHQDGISLLEYQAIPGDVNVDGMFNQTDLDIALTTGHYDDGVAGNSTWLEGDWNRDGDFDGSDIDYAMATGWFGRESVFLAVPEPQSLGWYGWLVLVFVFLRGGQSCNP